jgi:transcriptional regulator with XRE-family HTH domain
MRLVASSSAQVLLLEARQKLNMTQREFSDAVGSSIRTVGRWEDGSSSPGPWHFHKLAALLHPVDRGRAYDAALLGGKTLEELGLVELPPPAAAAAQSAAASPRQPPAAAGTPAAALPTRVLVDAVLFAAMQALGGSPPTFDGVRAAVHAAFAHARDLRLDPADVATALAPMPPAAPRDAAPEPPGTGSRPAAGAMADGSSTAGGSTRPGRDGRKNRRRDNRAVPPGAAGRRRR